ncbi:MAG: hypothetical protein DMG70_00075, partial [Acidobacteria bacterium]
SSSGTVSSLSAESWDTSALYEKLYCARGEMENRIKEQLSLFADHICAPTSCDCTSPRWPTS